MSKAQKQCFVRALAEYLVKDEGSKSIWLEMGKPWAMEWARLRGNTPLSGYNTVEEAAKVLGDWFGGEFQVA